MKAFQKTIRRRRSSLKERFSPHRRRSSSQGLETETPWHHTGAPRLLLTADKPLLDPTISRHFSEEGYDVAYLPFATPPKHYKEQVLGFADALEEDERYAIVGMQLVLQKWADSTVIIEAYSLHTDLILTSLWGSRCSRA